MNFHPTIWWSRNAWLVYRTPNENPEVGVFLNGLPLVVHGIVQMVGLTMKSGT